MVCQIKYKLLHVMPLLLGINHGRYFLLTGQTLSALEAKELGLVVLSEDEWLDLIGTRP